MSTTELDDEQLRAIYAWIDAIPLSRPKRNMARDFSDGVMMAEVISAYFPQLVELHNYTAANSVKQKMYNYDTLNQRVLKKLGFSIPKNVIEDIVNCKAGVIEGVLNTLQFKMAKYREKRNSMDGDVADDNTNNYDSKRNSRGEPGKENDRAIGGKNIAGSVNEEILLEKEQQIRELQETVEILELKIAKLEQLVRLKDNKIQKLLSK